MRWLLLAPLLFACPAPVDELVFQLPDGTTGRELAYDFGPRGGPASLTALIKNPSDHDVAIGEPQLEGDAFSLTGLSSTTLAPAGQLTALITFTPSAQHEGAVRITSAKGAALASLSLSGRLEAARCALPEVVDFGAVLRGERPQGTVAFPVVDARRDAYVGPPGAPFLLPASAPAGTESVAAGETLVARAVLSAPDAGEYSATWRLDPGGECAPKEVQLRATVLERHLGATPSTVDFGVIAPPGQPTATATILNWLSRPVSVTLELLSAAGGPTTNFRGGLTQLELPPATRDAMGTWRAGEAQAPLSAWLLGAGTVTGKLVVTSGTESIEVPLIARGAGAGLQTTPSRVELEIPEVEGQRLDVSTGVTVLNGDLRVGATAITVSSITVEADPGTPVAALCVGRIASSGACQSLTAPIVLAPGAQTSLALRITPQGSGPWRWFVVLHTDDMQQPELRFEVTARVRPMADCALTQPQALSFGAVRAPTPMVHGLVLENVGLATCVLQGLFVDGSADVRVPASSFIVGAGERRLLELEYLPSAPPGPSEFPTLRFSVNSASAPVRSVPLEIASDDGCLFVSPEQWDFGVSAPACGPRVQRFGVGNRCAASTAEVVIAGAQVTGSAAFSLEGAPTERLAPSTFEADAMRVRFDPSAAGVHAGTLELQVQVPGGTRTVRVPLRGRGDASGRQRDRFVMPSSADVLLVQDSSAGAGELQRGLSMRADSLLTLARSRNASVRIGGVRADETAATFGQLREVDGLRWLSTDAVSAPQLASLLDVGTAMTNPIEAFLGPALAALSGPTITGFNAGFVRRGASLNVVSLTNAGDGSAQPMSVLLPQLRALKGTQRPEWLSWSAVGPFAPATTGCTYDEASPNSVQRTVAQQLGGVVAEHCEVLASPQLFEASLAPTLFGTRAELSLRAPIETGALPNVIVAGTPIAEQGANMVRNWDFDVTRRSVTFSSLTLLPGDVVEFEYPTLCAP